MFLRVSNQKFQCFSSATFFQQVSIENVYPHLAGREAKYFSTKHRVKQLLESFPRKPHDECFTVNIQLHTWHTLAMKFMNHFHQIRQRVKTVTKFEHADRSVRRQNICIKITNRSLSHTRRRLSSTIDITQKVTFRIAISTQFKKESETSKPLATDWNLIITKPLTRCELIARERRPASVVVDWTKKKIDLIRNREKKVTRTKFVEIKRKNCDISARTASEIEIIFLFVNAREW